MPTTIQNLVSWSSTMKNALIHNQRQPLACQESLGSFMFMWLYELPGFTRSGDVIHASAADRRMFGVASDIRTVVPAALALGRRRRLHAHPYTAFLGDLADLHRAHGRSGRIAHSFHFR